MKLQSLLDKAFDIANLLQNEFDITILQPQKGRKHIHITSFYIPNRKMIIEFNHEEDNYVSDVNMTYNTLLQGPKFKKFFHVLCEPDRIEF